MADVELKNITKKFGNTTAVDDMSLKIESGELLSLLGPSGCGKTTTLRIIVGLTEPDEGLVFIGNEVVNEKPVHKRNIGMVFQSYALFPHMTVSENIAFGIKMKGSSKKESSKRIEEILELIQLPGIGDRFPKQLSGGQQQRVAFARAIVTEPSVLLLDEPLSNLDAKLREKMRIELKQLQEKLGITTIYVTHDQVEALTISDRVVILNQGKIEQVGSPIEVYETPATGFVANFIGQTNFVKGKFTSVSEREVEITTEKGLKIIVHTTPKKSLMGQAVCLAIRPERIRIIGKDEEGSLRNECCGKIEFVAYLGSETQYQVLLDGGERLIVQHQNIKGLSTRKKDDILRLGWNPEDNLLCEFSDDIYNT